MRYIVTFASVLIGFALLMTSFFAGQQLREIAASPLTPTLDNYPFLEFIGGDLMMGANDGASPAEMAVLGQQPALNQPFTLEIGKPVFLSSRNHLDSASQASSRIIQQRNLEVFESQPQQDITQGLFSIWEPGQFMHS